MGARQSKLKKELAALKEQAALAKTEHDAEVEALKSVKRLLEFKLNVLQELVRYDLQLVVFDRQFFTRLTNWTFLLIHRVAH